MTWDWSFLHLTFLLIRGEEKISWVPFRMVAQNWYDCEQRLGLQSQAPPLVLFFSPFSAINFKKSDKACNIQQENKDWRFLLNSKYPPITPKAEFLFYLLRKLHFISVRIRPLSSSLFNIGLNIKCYLSG